MDVNALTVSAVAAWCVGLLVRVLADADEQVVAVASDGADPSRWQAAWWGVYVLTCGGGFG